MLLFLGEIASRYPHENVIMVVDGAGWHRNHTMKFPPKLKLLFLPPYFQARPG